MPDLKVRAGLGTVNAAHCIEVDLDEWVYSAQEPLSTVGAATCLAVAVHHTNQGCLAHVMNTSLNQTELYHKACFTIREMILRIGGNNGFQIFLGAGWSFVKGSQYVTQERAFLDFDEYLTRFLAQMQVTAKIIDCRLAGLTLDTVFDTGNVVYDPTNGMVCILMTTTEKYAVQTGRRSAATQVCR